MEDKQTITLPDYLSKLDVNIDTATATAADAETQKFDEAGKSDLIPLRKPMQQILYKDGYAAQIPIANFKVHKVKPGNAKGVLGFQNTTVGEDTYTQLVFKPFDATGKAIIEDTELIPQPLLNLNGNDDTTTGPRERKMTSNMIANIADQSYVKGADGIIAGNNEESITNVKKNWYEKARNAFKAADGTEVFGGPMKDAKLVGGKSKKRRIQRRKSVRRRKSSYRKR